MNGTQYWVIFSLKFFFRFLNVAKSLTAVSNNQKEHINTESHNAIVGKIKDNETPFGPQPLLYAMFPYKEILAIQITIPVGTEQHYDYSRVIGHTYTNISSFFTEEEVLQPHD